MMQVMLSSHGNSYERDKAMKVTIGEGLTKRMLS